MRVFAWYFLMTTPCFSTEVEQVEAVLMRRVFTEQKAEGWLTGYSIPSGLPTPEIPLFYPGHLKFGPSDEEINRWIIRPNWLFTLFLYNCHVYQSKKYKSLNSLFNPHDPAWSRISAALQSTPLPQQACWDCMTLRLNFRSYVEEEEEEQAETTRQSRHTKRPHSRASPRHIPPSIEPFPQESRLSSLLHILVYSEFSPFIDIVFAFQLVLHRRVLSTAAFAASNLLIWLLLFIEFLEFLEFALTRQWQYPS